MSPEYRATIRKSQMMEGSSHSRDSAPLRIVCLLLAILSICLSVAIVGTTGNALNVYNVQRAAGNPWWLPLWSSYFDVSDNKSLIAAGAGIMVLNGLYLVLCLVPKTKFTAGSFRAMITAVTLSSASGILAIISVIFSAVLNKSDRDTTTIRMWTCRFDNGISSSSVFKNLQSDLTNDKFGMLCAESRFAFWGMVIVLGLQAALFVLAITQWAVSFWKKTTSSDDRPDSSTELGSAADFKISHEYVPKH